MQRYHDWGWTARALDNIPLRVWLRRTVSPSVWGCWTAAKNCVIPNVWHTRRIRAEVKGDPLSESIAFGNPTCEKNHINVQDTPLLARLGKGTASGYQVV